MGVLVGFAGARKEGALFVFVRVQGGNDDDDVGGSSGDDNRQVWYASPLLIDLHRNKGMRRMHVEMRNRGSRCRIKTKGFT